MTTRQILGYRVLDGKPTCRVRIPYEKSPSLWFFCGKTLKPVGHMAEQGYDDWLVRFRCPKCGTEEWIHSAVLPLKFGGMR